MCNKENSRHFRPMTQIQFETKCSQFSNFTIFASSQHFFSLASSKWWPKIGSISFSFLLTNYILRMQDKKSWRKTHATKFQGPNNLSQYEVLSSLLIVVKRPKFSLNTICSAYLKNCLLSTFAIAIPLGWFKAIIIWF